MSSPNDRVGEYSLVDNKENSFENDADYFVLDAENSGRRRGQCKIRKVFKLLIWVGQVLLLAANIYGFTVTMRAVNRDSVSNPMRAPIRYTTWTIFDEKDIAPYRTVNGSSNSDVDDQWNELLDIGAIKMDEAAKKRLPTDTARVYGEEFYAGVLEFEHQLHCLNRIRKIFYGSTLEEMGGTYANFTGHNDHCFQYLRQAIMCHADLEIMSMDRIPRIQGYAPNFHVVKQCRDFDLIHQWARELPAVDQDATDGSRDPANSLDHHTGHHF